MNEEAQIERIRQFSNANGIAGFEQEVVRLFADNTKDYGQLEVDGMLNAFLHRNGNTGDKPVVAVDAHSDAVGFMVQAVRPNGLIKFVTIGGWVPTNVPATRVKVRNKDGEFVPGVVATKPPHFMTAAERNGVPTIAEMSVDVGSTSREETINDFGIDTGCPIFVDVDFQYNAKKGIMLGKDFDDRLGAAALVDLFATLNSEQLDVDIVGSLSSQEEVGLRGAYVAARKIEPDIAIIFEGVPCDDTFTPDWLSQTGMGRGPMLRDYDTTLITNAAFQKFATSLADDLHIPYTHAVRTGGGQNGAAIGNWKGAPTIVVGIPVRYEHTPYNWASLADYKNVVRIGAEVIKRLNSDVIKSFSEF